MCSFIFKCGSQQNWNIFGPEQKPGLFELSGDEKRIALINQIAFDIVSKSFGTPNWLNKDGTISKIILELAYGEIPTDFLTDKQFVNLTGLTKSEANNPSLISQIRALAMHVDDISQNKFQGKIKEAKRLDSRYRHHPNRWGKLCLVQQIPINSKLVEVGLPVIPFTLDRVKGELRPDDKKFVMEHLPGNPTAHQNYILYRFNIPPQSRDYQTDELPPIAFNGQKGIPIHHPEQLIERAQLAWASKIFETTNNLELTGVQIGLYARRFIQHKLPYPKSFPSLRAFFETGETWNNQDLQTQVYLNKQMEKNGEETLKFTLAKADETLSEEEKAYVQKHCPVKLFKTQARVLFDSGVPPQNRAYARDELPLSESEIMDLDFATLSKEQLAWITIIFSTSDCSNRLTATQVASYSRAISQHKLARTE